MPPAELHRLSSLFSIWHKYDPAVKADLFSTAFEGADGLYLVDPIPLDPANMTELLGGRQVKGVVVTNANHERASSLYADQFSVPILARIEASISGATPLADGDVLGRDTRVLAIDGAAAGELALLDQREGGTMIIGDTLINMGHHGFTFLPPKYCLNHKQMKKSLRKLLEHPFERFLFAHGLPILTEARERLRTLLNGAT